MCVCVCVCVRARARGGGVGGVRPKISNATDKKATQLGLLKRLSYHHRRQQKQPAAPLKRPHCHAIVVISHAIVVISHAIIVISHAIVVVIIIIIVIITAFLMFALFFSLRILSILPTSFCVCVF